jgi:hypothetical protein
VAHQHDGERARRLLVAPSRRNARGLRHAGHWSRDDRPGLRRDVSQWSAALGARIAASGARRRRDYGEQLGEVDAESTKEMLRYFAALKTSEAKDRNVERMVGIFGGDTGRFVGRDWCDGK